MNMHIATDRHMLPRSLLGRRPTTFKFEIGDMVEHVSGGLLSIVQDRNTSSMGTEIYSVSDASDPSSIRTMRGPWLQLAAQIN